MIVSGKGKSISLTEFQGLNSNYALLVVFDCHGLSPVEISFEDQWKKKLKHKVRQHLHYIDLIRGVSAKYDDVREFVVSVCNLISSIKEVSSSPLAAAVEDVSGLTPNEELMTLGLVV